MPAIFSTSALSIVLLIIFKNFYQKKKKRFFLEFGLPQVLFLTEHLLLF